MYVFPQMSNRVTSLITPFAIAITSEVSPTCSCSGKNIYMLTRNQYYSLKTLNPDSEHESVCSAIFSPNASDYKQCQHF